MPPNIEKLLAMLTGELIKVREQNDLAEMHATKLEVDRFIKTEFSKLEEAMQQAYLEVLDGREEAEINGWIVTYKSSERFALDMAKITEFCGGQEALKANFYSHTITKPSLKFKSLKA